MNVVTPPWGQDVSESFLCVRSCLVQNQSNVTPHLIVVLFTLATVVPTYLGLIYLMRKALHNVQPVQQQQQQQQQQERQQQRREVHIIIQPSVHGGNA
jgi:hypothetical protein